MAIRKSKVSDTNNSAELVKAFVTLESFGVTQDDPVSTSDFAAEMGVTDAEAFHLLDTLANAELVDAKGRGISAEWWIDVPDVSAENAASIAQEALSGYVPEPATVATKAVSSKAEKDAEARARLAYAANVAESQDGDMQHATPRVIPAETPVIAADGKPVTVPVDPENNPKGARRELDASKGERLIKEERVSDIVASIRKDAPKTADAVQALADKLKTLEPKRLPEIDGLDQFIDAETGDMVYESRIVKMGLALPEPDSIPKRPEGVNPNMWDHAHTAITQQGRDWAMRQIVESLGITREAFDAMLNAA